MTTDPFWDIVGRPGSLEDANVGDLVCIETHRDGKVIYKAYKIVRQRTPQDDGSIQIVVDDVHPGDSMPADMLVVIVSNTPEEAGS